MHRLALASVAGDMQSVKLFLSVPRHPFFTSSSEAVTSFYLRDTVPPVSPPAPLIPHFCVDGNIPPPFHSYCEPEGPASMQRN